MSIFFRFGLWVSKHFLSYLCYSPKVFLLSDEKNILEDAFDVLCSLTFSFDK